MNNEPRSPNDHLSDLVMTSARVVQSVLIGHDPERVRWLMEQVDSGNANVEVRVCWPMVEASICVTFSDGKTLEIFELKPNIQ